MKTSRLYLVALLALFPPGGLAAQPQTPLFQSAELGSTGPLDSGWIEISDKGFFGWRFHVETPVTITGVGGHLFRWAPSDDGSFFAAITRLDSPTAFPSPEGGGPFLSEQMVGTALGSVTSGDTADYFFSLPTTLAAGDYALVFGSGMFGDPNPPPGYAVSMPLDNQSVPGATFIAWEGWNLRWTDQNAIPGATRFVVYTVPEPEVAWLMILALTVVVAKRPAWFSKLG